MIDFNRYFRAVSWDLVRDSLVVGSCLTGMGVILIMGGVSVFSNLANSGNALFQEQPWIPIALSALPAFGTLSTKFMINFIPERFTRHYQIIINGLAILSLIVWIVLFSCEFHNNSGGNMDMSSLDTHTTSFAIPYTMAQLLAELFVAATLFLAADEIAKKYMTDAKGINPDWQAIENEYQQKSKAHGELLNKRNQKKGELARFHALRKAYIQEITASYFNIASQLKP